MFKSIANIVKAIQWSQLFDDPQLFNDQLEVWTSIIEMSTVIPPSLMVLFISSLSYTHGLVIAVQWKRIELKRFATSGSGMCAWTVMSSLNELNHHPHSSALQTHQLTNLSLKVIKIRSDMKIECRLQNILEPSVINWYYWVVCFERHLLPLAALDLSDAKHWLKSNLEDEISIHPY